MCGKGLTLYLFNILSKNIFLLSYSELCSSLGEVILNLQFESYGPTYFGLSVLLTQMLRKEYLYSVTKTTKTGLDAQLVEK